MWVQLKPLDHLINISVAELGLSCTDNMGLQVLLLLQVLAVGTIHIASGSHFRGGLLSWKPRAGYDSSSYKVDFTFRLAFRRSFSNIYYCDQNTVNSNGIIGQGDYWRAHCTQYNCGSSNVGSVEHHCTDYSTSEDWSQGENNFTVNFPNAGPWLIGYSSCCWISLAQGGGSWYLSSTVNLTRRSDTGIINSSPITASSPIVRLQQGCKKVIKIPTEDPDGDKVRCRWSVGSSECGGACKSFKYGRLDEEACTITFDGNGQNGWYAVALMLEDYPHSTVDFSASSPFSSVGLQFLVNIASNGGSCNRKPYFTGSTPAEGSCLEIHVGSTYHASIVVKHVDSARRVQEINLVAPTGVLRSNILRVSDRFGEIVYQKNVSWTPSSSQTGQHIVCFTALDNSGIQSDRRCLTILVGLDRHAPMAVLGSRYPHSSVSYSGYGQNNYWSIRFDRAIKKPQKSSFIRFLVDGHVIFKLDTCVSKEVTVTGSNNTLLSFRTPSVVLSMRGTYSIVLDAGSVVGRGCSSDGPPTPGVTSPTQWRVYTSGYCSHGYYRGTSWPFSCLDVNECVNPAGRYRRSLPEDVDRKDDMESGTGSDRQKRWIYYGRQSTIYPSPVMMAASSPVAVTPAECSSYTTLSADRSTRTLSRTWNCDYWLNFGWYRFTSNAGARMPEYCVPTGRCGTDRPGWLNGTHPTSQEGVVARKACFHDSGNCCRWTKTISVRNCGGFYVYKLGPVPYYGCTRYCYQPQDGNTECSSYKALSSADRSVGYLLRTWNCDYRLNVGWYRFTGDAGTQMPEYCVPTERCGVDNPGWLNGAHPTLHEGAVTREVCFHYTGNCCRYNITVWVRNCGGFYVYRLEPPRWYCVRYCGSGNVSSSVQVTPSPSVQVSPTATQVWPSVVGPTQSVSAVRLVNGNGGNVNNSEGRVEVFINGEWGTVCDDSFDINDAHVFCRMLGYPGAVSAKCCAAYGQGSGRIWLDDVACYGNERSITECSHNGVGSHNCGHGEDAGIVCSMSGQNTVSLSLQVTPSPSIQALPTATQVWPSVVGPTQSACYQHYTGSSGYISSPNYPWVYNNNHDCIWNITIPYGYVKLQFHAFSLESCPYDYLDVIDTVGGQRLGRLCGKNLPPIMYSTGRHLVLHFHSDRSVRLTGFRIYYSTVHSVPSMSAGYINPTSTQPYLTPTPVQSVAPSASAIHDSFVLYLPANCQHDCVNTRGSYYCRCYKGYKLNPDRKTCSDINECDTNNGGCSHNCSNIPGSYYCACLQGQTISSDNKTCIEPGVDVTCNENYMQVHLERAHFKNFDPSSLHLWYQGCGATTNSTHISLRTALNGCGTKYNETHDKLTFYNEVNIKKTIIKGMVTRSFEFHIPFYCEYSKSSLVHVSFKPFGIIKGYEGGFGNFTFRMDLFKTRAYSHRYGADDYPISVQLNELLYIQYSVESLQSSLVVFADTCKATPSRDPYSWPQYVFLKNGCPEDTTLTLNYNQNPVQRFTIRAFKFLADYPVVYLHCRVMACHKNTVGSRCSRGCQRSIRKKRDLTNRETEKPQLKETQTYDVFSGAIEVRKDKTKENSGFDRAQATLVGSVSGVGGVFLIIAIILAVIVVKKGYIKTFKRRNKVDDIYGREQGTRTNKYVEEDDFAANEEDFTARADELTTKDEGFVVRDDVFVNGENKFTESGC